MKKLVRGSFLVLILFILFAVNANANFKNDEANSDKKNNFKYWIAKIIDEEKQNIGGYALKIPTSQGVAQAMLESGNGTSYYAKKKNNFFGLYYYPRGKRKIIKFESPRECVRFYLYTLSTHKGYKKYRKALDRGVEDPIELSRIISPVYAEDKSYFKQLSWIIRREGLEIFDV